MDPRFFLPCFHDPRASHLGHKMKENTWSITCRTDLALGQEEVMILVFTQYRLTNLSNTDGGTLIRGGGGADSFFVLLEGALIREMGRWR